MAKQIQIKVERIVDYEKIQQYYANCSMVSSNMYDFVLTFGKFHPEGNNKVIEKYEQIVYMSPQQAKALAKILQDHVSGYEKKFGEIKILVK
jgi:hypothetical protein